MKQSFLKTAITDTNTVVSSDGEVIQQDVKTIRYLANSRESFFLAYSSLLSVIQKMNAPEMKVYAYLLENYIDSAFISLPIGLKEEMSKQLGLRTGTISNAISGLKTKGLIYSARGKNLYRINPRFAFKGSTHDRNAALRVVLEMECPSC